MNVLESSVKSTTKCPAFSRSPLEGQWSLRMSRPRNSANNVPVDYLIPAEPGGRHSAAGQSGWRALSERISPASEAGSVLKTIMNKLRPDARAALPKHLNNSDSFSARAARDAAASKSVASKDVSVRSQARSAAALPATPEGLEPTASPSAGDGNYYSSGGGGAAAVTSLRPFADTMALAGFVTKAGSSRPAGRLPSPLLRRKTWAEGTSASSPGSSLKNRSDTVAESEKGAAAPGRDAFAAAADGGRKQMALDAAEILMSEACAGRDGIDGGGEASSSGAKAAAAGEGVGASAPCVAFPLVAGSSMASAHGGGKSISGLEYRPSGESAAAEAPPVPASVAMSDRRAFVKMATSKVHTLAPFFFYLNPFFEGAARADGANRIVVLHVSGGLHGAALQSKGLSLSWIIPEG